MVSQEAEPLGIPLEQAYETLHKAIIALGPSNPDTYCSGQLMLEKARLTLELLQKALLIEIDHIQTGEEPELIPVSLMMRIETLAEMENFRQRHHPNSSIEDMPDLLISLALKALRET